MKKFLCMLFLLCFVVVVLVGCEQTTESGTVDTPTVATENEAQSGDNTQTGDNTQNANVCTVTFDTQGGSEVATQQVKVGDRIVKPQDPEKAGYTFEGWTYSGEEWSFIQHTVTGNMTLTAQWQIYHTVTFNTQGGTEIIAEQVKEGDRVQKPQDPRREGYTFIGWTYLGENYSFIQSTATSDMTLIAEWQINTYIIAYTLNDGTNAQNNPTTFTVEDETITLIAPTRTGYTFVGWTWERQAEPQTIVTIPAGTHEDKAYVANWQVNTYLVTFNTNGGDPVESLTVTYDASYVLPIPTRTGYAFIGWYVEETQLENGTWLETHGVELTARWESLLVVSDGIVHGLSEYGRQLSIIEIPTVYNGVTVSEISQLAFHNEKGLTSVTIPNSVQRINNLAFYGCSGLTRIIFTGTMQEWKQMTKLNWNGNTGNYTVYCSDGEVSKSET